MKERNHKSNIDFPIDLVCMWVDGNDEAWQAKRNRYTTASASSRKDATNIARWRNNDELRYSLRSVEMYAPWINHIYIVTDGQCPAWLNIDHPKVTIVDHKEILPAEVLPVFNSHAIESRLYKIPNLSEHFILGNDDTLFVQPVEPSVFFSPEGKPIVRLVKFNRRKAKRRSNYRRVVLEMQDLVQQKFGKLIPLAPHHNFDAYTKTNYRTCVENIYSERWEATSANRFRRSDDMQRCFISYYMVVMNEATVRKVGRYNRIHGVWGHIKAFLTNRFARDSRVIPFHSKDPVAKMHKYNPLMFCANDTELATEEQCRRMIAFLKELYPTPSSFERE